MKTQWLRSPSFWCLSLLILMGLMTTAGWLSLEATTSHLDKVYQAPNGEFWLGTDFLGRSVLARTLHGLKLALFVGFLSAFLSTLIGLTLGLLSGFFGGWVDQGITALYTTLESIPYILLVSAFSFSMGPGIGSLCLALGLTGWVKLCRLIRSEVLKNREMEYVAASKALGVSSMGQIFGHILPNVIHLCSVQFSLSFILAIKLEVILSYLGLGVEPGTASWGYMISDAKGELTRGIWWNLTAASGAFFVLVLSVYYFAETLGRSLDPQASTEKLQDSMDS